MKVLKLRFFNERIMQDEYMTVDNRLKFILKNNYF